MTSHDGFCGQLRERLLANKDRVLLRVVSGPRFDQPAQFTGGAFLTRAEELASQLLLPKERSVVLLLLPHSPELFLLQVGLVLRGHVPAILAWPTSRIDAEKYQRNLVHQLSNLPADALVTLPRLVENLRGKLPYPPFSVNLKDGATYEKVFPAGQVSEQLESRDFSGRNTRPSADTLFLQFSGGTTGPQKAIVVTASMLSRQFEQLREALNFTDKDRVVSWLPLYHDMGLIACYWMPLWHGAPSLQMSANEWVMNPALLLKYVDKYRATFCWLPNFSFAYLSQRQEMMQGEYRLDSVRAWINCSEPVRKKSIDQFTAAFAHWGVHRENLQASYAMAETVFAITQSQLGRELLTIPRGEVRHGAESYSPLAFDLVDDVYVSSGKPLSDTKIKIVGPDGISLPNASPGEIYVQTPSLFSGYWGSDGFLTHSLHDGWHATGDFGFMAGDELFVIGRFKDIVIVGGNNIFPEDVEAVVNTISGIYPGRVVAFGVEDAQYGTQGLAAVAEMKNEYNEDEAQRLDADIRKIVMTTIGVAPRYVAVVPQKWIVKSTAGKISRRETRERFLREKLGTA
ncbi:MAG TPA: AMP-binding protein [Candidatus Limnocylindrales bacterium]|nr:AMP-binding protein [Candidatus Limnocylindrales bacterium]